MPKMVLSVGQCGADHHSLTSLLNSQFGAEVVSAASAREALAQLRRDRYNLVLVNRLFDRGGSGLDFIVQLKADASLTGVPVMLVSNYDDAQQQAVALGALPGFGKSSLGSPATLRRLGDALGFATGP